MGLDNTAAQTLCGARSVGADFSNSLMIGRQWLGVTLDVTAKICRVHGCIPPPPPSNDRVFAESFFEMLGAKRVDSLDFSTFEGANIQHDLNQPLPAAMRAQYDLVFDGGTLEHVFNFPQALKNCLELVRPGGHFVQVSNANNFMGHGFWQISPELIYRSMSAKNGYEIVTVMLRELHFSGRAAANFYVARDPDTLGWRVELANRRPTYLVSIAKRIADCSIFAPPPQQSDYQRLWDTGASATAPSIRPGPMSTAINIVRKIIPSHLERALRNPFANKAYKALTEEQVMRGQFEGLLVNRLTDGSSG